MLTRPMFRLAICLSAFSLSILGLKAQNDCNCNQQVVVQVNAQCTYVLSKLQLGIKNCPDSYIAVLDNKPQNRDTIDAPGSYTYGLYQNDGRLICLGNVMAMSPSGPVLDSVNFLQDTFSFQQIDDIFNRANTTGVPGSNLSLINNSTRVTSDGRMTELVNDNVANLGVPFFSMGCQTPRCGITLSFSDELVYSACREAQRGNLYATIRRSWLARDCQGRINSSAQFIHFKNPEKADFVWNLSKKGDRKITLYYGECSLSPNRLALSSIFPVTSKRNRAIFDSGLKISQAIQEKVDTTCDGNGLQITRNYLIYDECKNTIIDTFSLRLEPGEIKKDWLIAPSDTITLPIIGKSCKIGLPFKSKAHLFSLLQLKIDPLCKEQHVEWTWEYRISNNSDNWFPTRPLRDSLFLYLGQARITITVLDSCQNLYTKHINVLIKDVSPFDFTCPAPFEATFEEKNGKKYYYLNSLESYPNAPMCRTYETSYRRIISPACLSNFLVNRAYDLDQDGDIMEHFTFIRDGKFAKMYYSPWVKFIEAFACDEDIPVYYEQQIKALEENLEHSCLSYFTISSQKPVEFRFDDATVKMGSPICVPLKVNGLKKILGLQFYVWFDAKVIRLDSIKSIPNGPGMGNFGFPNTGVRPHEDLIVAWVAPGVKPTSFPANSTLFELCFTPLAIGQSPIWVDSTRRRMEITNENGVNLVAKSKVGIISIIDKNDFRNPIKQIQNTPPLSNSADGDKKVPDIRVFPNPSQDQVYISLPASWAPQGKIVLKDLQGRVLMRQEITSSISTLNLYEQVPNGVHLLEIQSQNQVWTQRIVVLKP
uniref:Secretion system C-terminal sorting domain-containing protein n=1 Tax=uncultured bacterium A1Q1_fos_97 TaxID=1256593 RepID=L7W2K8_9BACT|nr:hypothetical protein [uncultured bacterium A1Q1_fos_97]